MEKCGSHEYTNCITEKCGSHEYLTEICGLREY